MIRQDVRDYIAEISPEAVVFDNPSFDISIVGISLDGCVIYDLDTMVEELSKDSGMSLEDAYDFIMYNTMRSLNYVNMKCKPIIQEMRINEN